MRLFLLPISTRRTLIYCQRTARDGLHARPSRPSLVERATAKANEIWADFEKSDAAWKRTITHYGNVILRRIPFEEWGLKTIPPLNARRHRAELSGKEKVEVLFPGLFLRPSRVDVELRRLALERQDLHRQRMWWSIIAFPFTLPIALLPIIPNLPGFYLVFRAYSHWKALRGAQHLEFLCRHNLVKHNPSPVLDELYAAGLMYPARNVSREAPSPTREQCKAVANLIQKQTNNGQEDVMLLQTWNGKLLAERFKLPEMHIEIERAVEQVEKNIKAKEELVEEKQEIEKATAAAVRRVNATTPPRAPQQQRQQQQQQQRRQQRQPNSNKAG